MLQPQMPCAWLSRHPQACPVMHGHHGQCGPQMTDLTSRSLKGAGRVAEQLRGVGRLPTCLHSPSRLA